MKDPVDKLVEALTDIVSVLNTLMLIVLIFGILHLCCR